MANKSAIVRRHFFIDRNFQGKYMITFLVPMLFMLLLMLFTLYFASQSMITTSIRIIKEDVENTVATQLQDRPDPTVAMYQNVVVDIRDYLRSFSGNERYRKMFLSTLLWVFGAGVLMVIIQIVLLTIFVSHKIAGPIYRFEKSCHSIIEGNYNEGIHLRQGDDMQNLANLFNEMMEKTRKRIREIAEEPDSAKRKEIAERYHA